jgi:lysophospholipase L1-like esterase
MRPIGQPKWRNIVFAWLLLFGSLLVSALTAEVILRALGHHGAPQRYIHNIYPVEDPVLDWRYVPNSQIKEGRIVYTYNSSGFRDRDHSVPKPPGITRIVILGDSVTEGYGVEDSSLFSHILQTQLGETVEVISVAVGGLNTPQEVHLLEQEGIRYNPDLVIVNFILNDCDFYSNYKGAQRYLTEKDSQIGVLNLPINPEVKRLLKSSALVYFVKERVEELKGRIVGTEETNYFTKIWAKEDNRRKVTSAFDKLAGMGKEHGFDIAVIIWPLIMDYKEYRFTSVHQWVAQQAEHRGFSAIDLIDDVSEIPYRDLQITAEDNVHLNAVGHRIAAEAFLRWYVARDQRT